MENIDTNAGFSLEKDNLINSEDINYVKEKTSMIINEVSKIVVGQEEFIKQIVIVLFCGGHALIEGVPGLGKTLTAKTLAKTIGAECKRVQFTPDLMPADIIGTKVFDSSKGEFYLKKGPLFTNIFLADEINRTPPKTQSALLESMEEKAISIDGETYKKEDPFIVLATQNPVEYEGTYPLPEAQLDRFMMKINVDYVNQEHENQILKEYNNSKEEQDKKENSVNVAINKNEIGKIRKIINLVKIDESLINYITSIVRNTRNSPSLVLGASIRASISILLAAKANAAINGRDFATPDDIKDVALPILRHRIILKPELGIDGQTSDDVVKHILNRVEVPR